MALNSPEGRDRLKDKLLRTLQGAAGGLVVASVTLISASATPAATQAATRAALDERVAAVRKQAAEQAATDPSPGGLDTRLAWGNWHNWHNGWPNGWHNWHNWGNWA